jgi:hypothetical protein
LSLRVSSHPAPFLLFRFAQLCSVPSLLLT